MTMLLPSDAVRRLPVSEDVFEASHRIIGSVYFVKDRASDCVKIGHSKQPWERLSQLQVGNSTKLELIGLVAADQEVEAAAHGLCSAGHVRGEWFRDGGILSTWLEEVTEGRPLYRWLWDLVVIDLLAVPREKQFVWRTCK